MVNRYSTFNRVKTRRLKNIRDKKRARIIRKKKAIGYTEETNETTTKKEQRKMKRSENILKAAGIDDVSKVLSKRKVRRRNKRNKKDEKKMEIEED